MTEELYKCDLCGLHYREKEWVEKCRQWCSTHDSCNLEVIRHAVEAEKERGLVGLKSSGSRKENSSLK